MRNIHIKRFISIFICFLVIFTSIPITPVYAGDIPSKYSKYVTDGRVDYAELHEYYFKENAKKETPSYALQEPTSRFTVTVTRNGTTVATGYSDQNGVLYAQVGDTLSISNTSTAGSGKNFSNNKCDFQVSNGSSIIGRSSNFGGIKLDSISTNEAGTYNIYLSVMDNENITRTEGWGNWSYNGTHVSPGTNPGGGTGSDFPGWWYYSKLTVEVKQPEYSIEEKHVDRTTGTILDYELHKGITENQYTTYKKSFSGFQYIGSRAGYSYNDIANGTDQYFGSQTATFNSSQRMAFHYYYYKKELPPPVEGKANITVYYRNKNTGEAVAPTLEKKDVDYGTYTFHALDPIPSGYTFDAATTPSPQTVTVNAANDNVTIIFYYIPEGGGSGGDPENKPPIAIAKGPKQELAGSNVKFDGRSSYDPDGTIENYIWETPGGTVAQVGNGFIVVWYPYNSNYTRTETVKLTVIDDKGASDSTEVDVDILPPIPSAVLNISGIYKENRIVTLDASASTSPSRYPINSYIWTISNSVNVKSVAALNGNAKNNVLYKVAGTYSNKIEVKNTVGLADDEIKAVTIVPDQYPTANFSAVVKLLRDPADSVKNATITATNLSNSPDSDPIKATVMFYSYDSDNDGSFDDETWYYSLNGTTWLAAGLTYAQLKAGSFDIFTKGTGNPATFTVKTNQVGKYKFEAMTIENIPAADTIPSLITAADYRRNSTFTSKPDSEKIIEIINTAPTVSFEVKKKKEVDILIATDYTDQKLANLQAALNVQKATLLAKNIDVKYTIVNTTSPVAHVNDAKFWYRRYARYNYRADRESWSSGGGGNDAYDKNYQETLLWEEQQALESEVGYLPPRMPRNVTWSKSGIIFEEDEEGEKNWEREYYNVTVMAQNDIKTSGIIKKTVYSRGGMSTDTSYGYQYSNIHMESVSLDSSFVKEEKIADLVLDVNSINFASLTSAALRENSDRYLLFIGDSSSKVYSGEWGTHFPFGGLTKSEQDYIKANNINPYIVTPQTTLDTVIGAEKAKEVYGGTIPYFKTTDGAYYTILENYPAMLNLEGEIQEIFGEYILLTNGTLKYRVGGASFATVVTGVTKVIKEKSTYGYETGDSNSIWVVTSNGKLRQCLSGSTGITLDYPNALDVFNNSGLRYGEGTYTISCTDGSYFRYENGTVLKVSDLSLHSVSGVNIYDQEFDYTTEYGGLFVSSNGAVRLGVLWHASTWNSERNTYEYYIEKVNLKSLYRGRWSDEDRMYYANTGASFPTVKIIADGMFIVDGTANRSLSIGLDYSGTYQRYFALTSEPSKILINYKDGIETYADGTLGMPFKSYYAYSSNDRDRSGYITTMWDVPELRGKTISKAYVMECVTIILTSDNSLYAWIDRRNYGQGGRPTTCGLTLLTNNAGAIMKGAAGASYNSQAGIYHDKNDGTVRSMADKSILFSNVVDTKSTADNTIFYTVTKDGSLYKDNQTTNLIKTRLVINDTTKQYITLRSILNGIPSTKYFTAGQYTAAVQDITNLYLNDISYTTNYILLNDMVVYNSTYADYENDPKYAETWAYAHNANYFDNSLGLASFNGQTLTSPVTTFPKVGLFTINAKVRDNPKTSSLFDNYKLWSTGNQNLLLYVHRKPIACPSVMLSLNGSYFKAVATDAGSYDPDHTSRSDKGITASEWSWRESTQSTWTFEKLNKTDCDPAKTYIVRLRVKDIEGVWSDYAIYMIDSSILNVDATPIQSIWTNSSVTAKVSAFVFNGVISNVKHRWTTSTAKPTSGWSTATNSTFDTTASTQGIWYLHMEATDSNGNTAYRYRGPYQLDLTAPAVDCSPTSYTSTSSFNVTVSASDTGGSGLKQVDYQLTTSTSKPASGWNTTTSSSFSVSVPDGSYYLHMQAFDNAGNSYYRNRGPFTYSANTAPTVTMTKTPAFVYEGDTVRVNVTPQDANGGILNLVLEEKKDSGSWTTVMSKTNVSAGVVQTYTKSNIALGNYQYRVTVTDPYGETATASLSFTSHPLGVTGTVSHTTLWNEHRIQYNEAKTGNSDSPRAYSVFFPGEKFVLNANTTAIDSQSTVTCSRVNVKINGTSFNTDLTKRSSTMWDGSLWDSIMEKWGNQDLTFIFTAYYSNGITKTYNAIVTIGDDNYWRLHMKD